jgi:hypothetical protein
MGLVLPVLGVVLVALSNNDKVKAARTRTRHSARMPRGGSAARLEGPVTLVYRLDVVSHLSQEFGEGERVTAAWLPFTSVMRISGTISPMQVSSVAPIRR